MVEERVPLEHKGVASPRELCRVLGPIGVRGRLAAPCAKFQCAGYQGRGPWLVTFSSLLILAIILSAPRVAAQVDPWEFEVYPYATEERGVVEFETDNAVVPNGHNNGADGTAAGTYPSQGMWYDQYELTYGFTNRIEAAAYLDMAGPSDNGYHFAGSNFRLHGKLLKKGSLPVDVGWYIELEWRETPEFDKDPLDLELRPIFQKNIGRWSILLNPQFEKSILVGPDKNQGFQFGYSTGVYYRLSRYLSPGVESYGAIGNIDDNTPLYRQQHYIFAVIRGKLPHGIEYNIGPGFGLTRGSDHVIMKFNVSLERFVAAVFGPSSNSGWFF
jgi:hypothetical protein